MGKKRKETVSFTDTEGVRWEVLVCRRGKRLLGVGVYEPGSAWTGIDAYIPVTAAPSLIRLLKQYVKED